MLRSFLSCYVFVIFLNWVCILRLTYQVLSLLLFRSSCLFLQNSWYLVELLYVLSAQLPVLLTSQVFSIFDSVDEGGKMWFHPFTLIPTVRTAELCWQMCPAVGITWEEPWWNTVETRNPVFAEPYEQSWEEPRTLYWMRTLNWLPEPHLGGFMCEAAYAELKNLRCLPGLSWSTSLNLSSLRKQQLNMH